MTATWHMAEDIDDVGLVTFSFPCGESFFEAAAAAPTDHHDDNEPTPTTFILVQSMQ